MWTRTLFISSLLVALCACGIPGNGHLTTESRPVRAFTSVQSELSIRALVRPGSAYSVVVTVDSNLQEEIRADFEGDRLVLRTVEEVSPSDRSAVEITLPSIEALTLRGSGDLEAFGLTAPSALALVNEGSGSLSFRGSATSVRALMEGSGSATLEGSTESVIIDSTGSGTVDARRLVARDGAVSSRGSGSVALTANGGVVRASIEGSGSIECYGTSAVRLEERSGSGRLYVF